MRIVVMSFVYWLLIIPVCNGQEQWKILKQELIAKTPSFKQSHASTLVQLPSGKIMAAWFAGSYEGAADVCVWNSIYKKGRWGKPNTIATGVINDTLRYPCWNPVLFLTKNNKLLLFYKVGPSPQLWWGMMMTSVDEGKTWSAPVRMADGLLGAIKNKPILLPDGTILSPSSIETKTKWSSHIEKSTDNGATWQKILIDTTGFDIIQPSILNYGHKKLQLLFRSRQGYIVQSWSFDDGTTWGPLSNSNIINPNAGIDAVTLANGEQLIVYNPDVPGKDWFNGRNKLAVAVSTDGIHWKDILLLENGQSEEFSYPAVIQTKDLNVHITYTYNRQNIKHVVIKKIM